MKSFQSAFSLLQRIGKCMMLPVSVLPVAGILLGVGSANFSWLPDPASKVMAASGSVIFGSLPLLFAIGVAIGLTENDGVAALAGTVGFAVFLASMGVFAGLLGIETKTIMGLPTIETGVFGGILVGLIAAAVFNRFYRVQLPSYLGFFAGKRSVPIITAFAAIALAAVLILIWPPIGRGIEGFSYWAVLGRPALAFTIYGIVERALIPFGLHHVWNVPFFFQAGSFTDPATGIVVVPRIWIAHDVGRSINAAAVIGQVEGSIYMGLGEALMEEMAYRGNRNVVHKIPSLLEYKSPTTLEMCDVVTYLIEDPDPNGPFGAKEVGQGPLLPVMPAVANAVYDAVGVRVDEVPVTPEKVFKALKRKEKGEAPRFGPESFPDIPWPEPTRVPTPAEGGDGKAAMPAERR